MTTDDERVKVILCEGLSDLLAIIENDFGKNIKNKRKNFLLKPFDETIKANMVFVSSFESKFGNAIETCARNITKLKFGDANVPTIINPNNVIHNFDEAAQKGQIIVTNTDIKNGNLKGEISAFMSNNERTRSGVHRFKSGVTQDSIRQILPLGQKYVVNTAQKKPVDLAFFDGIDWNLLELKAGGNLDSSNAPSNVEKLLMIYTGLNVENAKIFFGTYYNMKGEGNNWTGSVTKYMAFPEMFLIGKDFWNKILPFNIQFEHFTEIYGQALQEINLDERVRSMIERAIHL